MEYAYTWRTKEGWILEANDFKNRHLLNTIAYIEKTASKNFQRAFEQIAKMRVFSDMDSPEGEYARNVIQELSEKTLNDYLDEMPIYWELKTEAEKRGLL